MNKSNSFVILVLIMFMLLSTVVCAEDTTAYNQLAADKYSDVSKSDWFAEAVGKMSVLKIIDGLPGGSFNPKGEVTRAQFVKMLVQAMEYKKIDSVSFDDLKPFKGSKPHWACVYIETALRNGVIVKDEIGNNFYPDVPLTRKDMGMMMFRALKLEPSAGNNPFADLTEANDYLTKLYEEYLIRGTIEGGRRLYKPEGLTTRAEAAIIISRMVDYKEDPEEYVRTVGLETRLKEGTATKEDVAAKRQMEIEKAKTDPNYIMEPMIRILNTLEDFKGYEDAERKFNRFAGHIALDNFEDYLNYTPECQFKIVCTTEGKDLLNTVTRLTQPFISYDHVYEERKDVWKPTEETSVYRKELGTCSIKAITRDEEKAVDGKWKEVPNYVKTGETLNFKLYIKRGSNTKEYDIVFKVN